MPVIGWLVALLWQVVLWLARSRIAVALGVVSLVTAASIAVLGEFLSVDAMDVIEDNWGVLPPEVRYMLWWCSFDIGVGLVMGSWIARFIIRRIPVVG